MMPTRAARIGSYRSMLAPRTAQIQRSCGSCFSINSSTTRMRSGNQPFMGSSGFRSNIFSSTPDLSGIVAPIDAIHNTRKRDKRDLTVLNDKFAQYVERIHFLEAVNRKLKLELKALGSRSPQ
jgi:hypothetical protein